MVRAKALENGSHTYTVVFKPDEEAGGYTGDLPRFAGPGQRGRHAGASARARPRSDPLLPGKPAQRWPAPAAGRGP
jgi:hypothetical protein